MPYEVIQWRRNTPYFRRCKHMHRTRAGAERCQRKQNAKKNKNVGIGNKWQIVPYKQYP